MTISENGLKLIKGFEGCRFRAYQDSVGVWTIGYGVTGSLIDGRKVERGLTITQEEADNNLTTKISKNYGVKVNRLGLDLTQNQYDAMVSLCYNLGSVPVGIVNAFKANDMETVKTKWLEYCHAGGKILQGLVNRRKKELELFNS